LVDIWPNLSTPLKSLLFCGTNFGLPTVQNRFSPFLDCICTSSVLYAQRRFTHPVSYQVQVIMFFTSFITTFHFTYLWHHVSRQTFPISFLQWQRGIYAFCFQTLEKGRTGNEVTINNMPLLSNSC
jgi:hypothetical protein